MKELVCPKCFFCTPQDKVSYGCANSACERAGIPETVWEGTPIPPKCSACGEPMKEHFCPECGYPIPPEDENVDTLPISIVGGEGCGKSNYLSVLIDQIKRSMGKVYNCSLYPMGGDETIVQYEQQYYQPLFVNGTCIESTQQDDILPLVYSLVFTDPPRNGKTCNLTFYDACGSNFTSEKVMTNYNRSIYNSKGILFLIDPSQLPRLRDLYREDNRRVCEEDAGALLSRTIHLIRQCGDQKNIKKKITIPIAVCITKLDTLRPLLDTASFLRYPSRHMQQPSFDMMDYNCCNLEVQSLIESWAGVELVNQITAQFATCGFFSFSSLGNPPNSQNQIHHIAPYRVCDPLLWLLRQNRVIRQNAGAS